MNNFQGGFSDDVVDTTEWEEYTAGGTPAGYIGAGERTKESDQVVEWYLREIQKLQNRGIAVWLTSVTARHFADGLDVNMTSQEIISRLNMFAAEAFLDVTIWTHPDHEGTWGSSKRLKARLKEAVSLTFVKE